MGTDRRPASFVQWNIDAVREVQTFGDGSSLPFFRFVSRTSKQRPVSFGIPTPEAGRLPLLSAGRATRVADDYLDDYTGNVLGQAGTEIKINEVR